MSQMSGFKFQQSFETNIDSIFSKNDYILWNAFLNSIEDMNIVDLDNVKVELSKWFADNVCSFEPYPKPGILFALRKLWFNNKLFKNEEIIYYHQKCRTWILDQLPQILTTKHYYLHDKDFVLLFLECIDFLQDKRFDQSMSLLYCNWIAQCFTPFSSNFIIQYRLLQFMDMIVEQLDLKDHGCLEISANNTQICMMNYLSNQMHHTNLDFTQPCLIEIKSHDLARELYVIGLRVLIKLVTIGVFDSNGAFFKLFQDFQKFLRNSIISMHFIEECVEIVCGGDDDLMIICALCHLKLWLLKLRIEMCCPYRMAWLIIVKTTNSDSTLILDWLTAPETSVHFLEYLLRLVKLLIVQFPEFLQVLDQMTIVDERRSSSAIDCFMSLLIRTRMSLERLHDSELLQFNPRPLTRQIEKLEDIYESHD